MDTKACGCCGGEMPAGDMWEDRRNSAGECDGSVDSAGRCRAFGDDSLWSNLRADADTDHEDARSWYESYGWHLSTEDAGDVTLQAVEYDWLDESDDLVVVKLMDSDSDLTQDDAESIVDMARTVRESAESLEAILDEVVEKYEVGDEAGVMKLLRAAKSAESDAGDWPATNNLASSLLYDSSNL